MKTKDSVKDIRSRLTPLTTTLALLPVCALAQTPSDVALDAKATVATTSPVVTLSWPAVSGARDPIYVTRTELTAAGRGSARVFTLATNSTDFADNTAAVGKRYEYLVSQRYNFSGSTWITRKVSLTSGSEVPLTESRGRVLLLVDNTMSSALAGELETLADDLTLDGWVVVRKDVARMSVAPEDLSAGAGTARATELAAVRSEVAAFYNADTANSRAVIIIGRVPVPYSGKIMPDGHTDHNGAWPTDMYYADINGSWTDTSINWTAAGRLNNVPGDGKFDRNQAPTALELEVGRIDFAGINGHGKTEVELVRQYLNRNHAYRNALAPYDNIRREVLVDDNFGYFNGEAFAAVGWSTGSAVVGRTNASAGNFFADPTGAPVLFGYGCGGGGYSSATGIGTSGDFASKPNRVVFNALFGSYFGDWNFNDAFLRAAIGGPATSTGLASFWVNRPNWDFSGTAMGGSIGSTLRYSSDRSIHRQILGDPTLRFQHRPAVKELAATPAADGLSLTWTATGAGEIGYHIYRTDNDTGITTRLTGESIGANSPSGDPLTATQFVSSGAEAGKAFTFTVRPVFRETTPGGTYYDLGLGAFISATQPGPQLAVESAVSRRSGPGGDYDLAVGGFATEPRAVDGELTVVVRFNQDITGGELSITGAATIESAETAGRELTLRLRDVADRQNLMVNVANISGQLSGQPGSFSLPVRILCGDTDRNGIIESKDVSLAAVLINANRGQMTGTARICDFNNDGRVNANDLIYILRRRNLRLD